MNESPPALPWLLAEKKARSSLLNRKGKRARLLKNF